MSKKVYFNADYQICLNIKGKGKKMNEMLKRKKRNC